MKRLLKWREHQGEYERDYYYDLIEANTDTEEIFFYIHFSAGFYFCHIYCEPANVHLKKSAHLKKYVKKLNTTHHTTLLEAKIQLLDIADKFGYKVLDKNLEIYL
jgi:hypothetical protein